jgi:sulfur relay (sulfurtransferase) DsrC/TusE family protein
MGAEKGDVETYRSWCVKNFSGVVCIDEVRDGKRTILFATDPLNDFTIAWKVNSKDDQESMDAFLQQLKNWGVNPEVAITDGSSLYKEALKEHWKCVAHQLCVFHVIKEVNKVILDGVREVKNRLKRLSDRDKKRRRGRPCKGDWWKERRGRIRKKQAKFIWENQHLIVKKSEKLSVEDKEALESMFEMAPELKVFRAFNEQFYSLFEKGIAKEEARRRWEGVVNNRDYQCDSHLAKALRMLSKERFEKMIVFMDYENCERTNNHVERNNRGFRLVQKTRYKRRRARTIELAIWLDVLRRWRRHRLHGESGAVKLCATVTVADGCGQKEAA